MKHFGLIVIGGSAAGLSAAINAKRINGNLNVAVIEKLPRAGKKILATGNGRCNLTNLNALTHRYTSADFAAKALNRYPPQKVIGFFESMGVLCRADSEGRVYPRNNMAACINDCLRFEIAKLGVELVCEKQITNIVKKGGRFILNNEFSADKIIIATGGKASPSQGSDGSGYSLAKTLGHSVTPLYPALVPVTVLQNVKPLKGIRASNVELTLENGGEICKTKGEILFTENGISGIAAMELAAPLEKTLSKVKSIPFTKIDFLPEMAFDVLLDYLKKIRNINGFNCIDNILSGVLPKALGIEICKVAILYKSERKIASLSDSELESIAQNTKRFVLSTVGTKGFANAQVTSGGIKTDEIDPETMQSKVCRGLYFAGEIIDVDGNCGGFNLQWAWASGLLAGELL